MFEFQAQFGVSWLIHPYSLQGKVSTKSSHELYSVQNLNMFKSFNWLQNKFASVSGLLTPSKNIFCSRFLTLVKAHQFGFLVLWSKYSVRKPQRKVLMNMFTRALFFLKSEHVKLIQLTSKKICGLLTLLKTQSSQDFIL